MKNITRFKMQKPLPEKHCQVKCCLTWYHDGHSEF